MNQSLPPFLHTAELVSKQDGTDESDYITSAVIMGDGSVVFCGYTFGDFGGTNAGGRDFLVVKLDVNGEELWRWQVKTS